MHRAAPRARQRPPRRLPCPACRSRPAAPAGSALGSGKDRGVCGRASPCRIEARSGRNRKSLADLSWLTIQLSRSKVRTFVDRSDVENPPSTADRLVFAAMKLFLEKGYGST